MPIYLMHCDHCDSDQDIYRSIAKMDDDLPVCCETTMRRKIVAPAVFGDIQPYLAMGKDIATGKLPVIESRSEHRAYLKRNNYVEVGNEMPKMRSEVRGDFNVRKELRQAVQTVLSK